MKKVLITGSNGFIGRNLKEKLSLRDYHVVAPKREELNLLNTVEVKRLIIKENFDYIFHSANVNTTRQETSKIPEFESLSLEGNLRMFHNIARYREYFGKMFYFGSGAEYGRKEELVNIEEEDFNREIPEDVYGFSKYLMSEFCNQYSNVYDLRLFGVYGKYEEWNRRFISNAICRGLKNLPITIQKNVYFDYLWIDDLVDILDQIVGKDLKYKHYNICSGKRIDLLSLAVIVKNELNNGCSIEVSEQGLKKEYSGSNMRLLQEIGEFEFTTHEEAIKQLICYYKRNLDTIVFDK